MVFICFPEVLLYFNIGTLHRQSPANGTDIARLSSLVFFLLAFIISTSIALINELFDTWEKKQLVEGKTVKAKEKIEIQNQSKSIQTENKFIIIKIEYKNVKIYIPDILFIEAIDNYSKIHTYQKNYLTHQNLKNISSVLPENEFIRVHKSFIIHIPKISHFTNRNVVVGEKTLPVGRTYAYKFLLRMKLP